jgi:AraC family transcriptional regulator
MYLTSLPDHNTPGFDEALHFNKFKKHNIVFKAASDTGYCERHVGCLSIKTVQSGLEWYGVNHRKIALRPGQFLILNDDQEYSCKVDRHSRTTILSIFFSHAFASSVLLDASNSEDASLDNFHEIGRTIPEFFQTLSNIGPKMQQKLFNLTHTLDQIGYEPDVVDEHLTFLLNDMLRENKINVDRANSIRSVKPATKTEIYKRLCIAKDFMHATFMDKPDLALIGRTACLSVPQLIRQFKVAFEITPHQYLTQIRLSHAAEQLSLSRTPVNEIALACGFEDNSAFSRAFKSKYGVQPSRFKKV